MSFELAGKIKELARIALEAKAKVDALEARVVALEAGMPSVIPESIVKRVVEQMRDKIPATEPIEYVKYIPSGPVNPILPSTVVVEKRKPGRPRKVE